MRQCALLQTRADYVAWRGLSQLRDADRLCAKAFPSFGLTIGAQISEVLRDPGRDHRGWLDVGDAAVGDGLSAGDMVDGDGLGVGEVAGVGERLVRGV